MQRRAGLLARIDILDRYYCKLRRTMLVAHQRHSWACPDRPAALMDIAPLIAIIGALAGYQLVESFTDNCAILGMNELNQRSRKQFGLGIPDLRLKGSIAYQSAALQIGQDDANRGTLEDRAEVFLTR